MFELSMLWEIAYLALTVLFLCYIIVDISLKRDVGLLTLDPYYDSIIREDTEQWFMVLFAIIIILFLIIGEHIPKNLFYETIFPFIILWSSLQFFINYAILKRVYVK